MCFYFRFRFHLNVSLVMACHMFINKLLTQSMMTHIKHCQALTDWSGAVKSSQSPASKHCINEHMPRLLIAVFLPFDSPFVLVVYELWLQWTSIDFCEQCFSWIRVIGFHKTYRFNTKIHLIAQDDLLCPSTCPSTLTKSITGVCPNSFMNDLA